MAIPRLLEDIGIISGKRVLLRLDLNVPIKNGKVFDDFRIVKSLPTINYLKNKGAKVIIISHIGENPGETLFPVAEYLKARLLPADPKNIVVLEGIDNLKNGEAVMLENLRQNPGEVLDDEIFAKGLASLADLYVDDAFAVMHRTHASIVSVPKLLPGFIGLLAESEVKNLSLAFNPSRPFLFIVGGTKFETKIKLVKKFVDIADKVFIGGALSNTVFKFMGLEVGVSLADQTDLDLSFVKDSSKVILPVDVNVRNNLVDSIKRIDEVLSGDNMLDVGPATVSLLEKEISVAKFILWNGPMGNYEKGFAGTTADLANMISRSGATSIVGGGDTIASIKSLGLLEKFTFVSTGGGAMLDFLADGILPGIEALKS
ncbi:MAG: phosphoglycerate kinase [Candidatus Vogelbacteria bacterium]|nr:phosphoglycerate kinase [Candidatus Vogelbacteria bacterium]